MTRKHFLMLALIVKYLEMPDKHRLQIAEGLARFCVLYNSRFDKQRFFDACEVRGVT